MKAGKAMLQSERSAHLNVLGGESGLIQQHIFLVRCPRQGRIKARTLMPKVLVLRRGPGDGLSRAHNNGARVKTNCQA